MIDDVQRGKLIVISAPSGSGKTTIAKEIMKLNPMIGFSVSATTRKKRDSETDGKDYYFLSDEEFKQRIEQGDFVEWEEVYPGKLYGTLKAEVEKLLSTGRDILFDLDVKGGLSIKKQFPEACLIFIRPPSFEVLKQRLQGRRTEDEATVLKRLERVPLELELGVVFEYQVVNDGLQQAVAEVQTIVEKHLHH
ncbi:MAG: guanylate kinase [bacterium]